MLPYHTVGTISHSWYHISHLVPYHTVGTVSHSWYRITQLVPYLTVGTVSHSWYRVTQLVPYHTVGTVSHSWYRITQLVPYLTVAIFDMLSKIFLKCAMCSKNTFRSLKHGRAYSIPKLSNHSWAIPLKWTYVGEKIQRTDKKITLFMPGNLIDMSCKDLWYFQNNFAINDKFI